MSCIPMFFSIWAGLSLYLSRLCILSTPLLPNTVVGRLLYCSKYPIFDTMLDLVHVIPFIGWSIPSLTFAMDSPVVLMWKATNTWSAPNPLQMTGNG